MKKLSKAWAIDTCSVENHGLLGPYWWFGGRYLTIPTHLRGCPIALFKTRALARKAVREMKKEECQPFPKAKVVSVEVCITWGRGHKIGGGKP